MRRFVAEELIPHEVAAEMNGGELARDIRARHKAIAKAIGFDALACPATSAVAGLTISRAGS